RSPSRARAVREWLVPDRGRPGPGACPGRARGRPRDRRWRVLVRAARDLRAGAGAAARARAAGRGGSLRVVWPRALPRPGVGLRGPPELPLTAPVSDPVVRAVLRRARVARVATQTASGRPFLTPLWFVVDGDALVIATG